MLISEVIVKLQEMKDKLDDVPLYSYEGDGYSSYPEDYWEIKGIYEHLDTVTDKLGVVFS